VTFPAFNSIENARDMDSVRAALGYDTFNFYGVSYGSELGQFLIRERPTALRSVILDAVVPLGFSLVTDVPAVKQQVMQRYAQACKDSPACNTAYPDLGKRYLALLERLDRDPVPLFPGAANAASVAPASAAAGATGKTAKLTGKMLDSALYQSVYQRESVSLMPYIVERAEMGDYSFVANFAQIMKSKRSDLADGMYTTVVCSEYGDTPQEALRFPGVIKRLAEAGQIAARQLLDVCRDWNIRLLEKSLIAPVKSDLPTLLLSGRFDPITPPEGADRVAANLANSYRVTFASGTHGQVFVVPCANAIVTSFLDALLKACFSE
jgi:pimeloyl-ACP methyl ester carboxylesterase